MKILSTLFAVVVMAAGLVAAGVAFAQIDPDPSGVGIYFDEAATVNATTAAAPAEFIAYLIVTRVSVPGYAGHCEGFVDWSATGLWLDTAETVAGYDQATDDPPYIDDDIYADFESEGIATGPTMVLKRYHFRLLDDFSGPRRLYVRSMRFWVTGPSGWVEVGLHPSSGDWSRPVAVINGEAPVPAQSASWTEVKTLYRRP